MPIHKFRIKRKSITQAIIVGTTTISHNLGKIARHVAFKNGGADESFVWNDKSGSTTQIDVQSLDPFGAIEVNIMAY